MENNNETSKQIEIKLSDLWDILKRCWILVAAARVLVSLISFIFMKATHTPTYTSTVSIWAFRNNESTGSDYQNQMQDYYSSMVGSQMINDYKVLLTSNKVVKAVQEASGNKISDTALLNMLKITHEEETRVFYITVTANKPDTAKTLVDLWGDKFCEIVNQDLMRGQEVVQVIDYGSLPTVEEIANPVSFVKAILIGFVCAILVYAVFFVRFLMDDKVNSASDVERYLDLHLLGAIPDKKQLARKKSKYGYYNNYANRPQGQKQNL